MWKRLVNIFYFITQLYETTKTFLVSLSWLMAILKLINIFSPAFRVEHDVIVMTAIILPQNSYHNFFSCATSSIVREFLLSFLLWRHESDQWLIKSQIKNANGHSECTLDDFSGFNKFLLFFQSSAHNIKFFGWPLNLILLLFIERWSTHKKSNNNKFLILIWVYMLGHLIQF